MVGIFDSGLGGLTVARAIMKRLPNWPLVYFGDTARMPYGNKSKKVIEQYAIENTDFLLKKGAKIIVIACNTVSALAYETLKKKFNVSIFEVITPAAKEALKTTRNGRVGIIGTRATINSGIYNKKLRIGPPAGGWKLEIFSQSCPLLVPLIEEGWSNKPETESILRQYLKPLRAKKIDTLILGCTHYPLLKPLIKKIMGAGVTLVDSAEAVASGVYNQFHVIPNEVRNPLRMQARMRVRSFAGAQDDKMMPHQFYVSDLTPNFQTTAEKWLGQKIKIQIANL